MDPDTISTIIARLKIYEASVQTAKLSTSNMTQNAGTDDRLNDELNPIGPDHSELRKAIAALEHAQTQIVSGSLVRHKVTGEIGRVITIFNTNGFDDTYVAFWGHERLDPTNVPHPRPYVLRYCLSSLEQL